MSERRNWRNLFGLQGLNNQLIEERHGAIEMHSSIVRHERLGGVLNYYDRRAA